jgi:hypothetical protein
MNLIELRAISTERGTHTEQRPESRLNLADMLADSRAPAEALLQIGGCRQVIAPRVAGPRLQQLFAMFMLIAAGTMVWRELPAG